MSSVDLATLALHMHRRHEMETRVNTFLGECDQTINNIKKMKDQARGIIQQLNCDPSEFKEKYLKCVLQLEEFNYQITDINMQLDRKLEGISPTETTPVHDFSTKCLTPTILHNEPTVIHRVPTIIHREPPIINNEPFNIMDVLSEPAPSTSTACNNYCPAEKPKKERKKVPKEEQLIVFSSASSSNESISIRNESVSQPEDVKNGGDGDNRNADNRNSDNGKDDNENGDNRNGDVGNGDSGNRDGWWKKKVDKVVEAVKEIDISEQGSAAACLEELPAQSVLTLDESYHATIMCVDGADFWAITDEISDMFLMVTEMTRRYTGMELEPPLRAIQLDALNYCAYYDYETKYWYRGLLDEFDEEMNVAVVFLVDTGEHRTGGLQTVRPLHGQYTTQPPYARKCSLATVEFLSQHDASLIAKRDQFMHQYIGTFCIVRIEDNTSETLGVSVTLPDGTRLEELLVRQGLAYALDAEPPSSSPVQSAAVMDSAASSPVNGPEPASAACAISTPVSGPPEMAPITDSDLDLLDVDEPEHEDALEAVVGYSCRDEADICKHYKGGPEKTCFKGARCKKKHILHHPDGWTLDKVEAIALCESLPLPAPDSWLRVHVTCVQHFNRIYVQLVADEPAEPEEHRFGMMLPPRTLSALVLDMNSPAQRCDYKPFTLVPAAGELVAAIYPYDGQYYRARVLVATPSDKNVEIFYIDYGNSISVQEDKLFMLPERYACLPEQAVRCRVAGVEAKSSCSKQWAAATKALSDLVLDQTLDAHVIMRGYDDLTLELFDAQGHSIAEELAAKQMVKLSQFQVVPDTDDTHQIVPA